MADNSEGSSDAPKPAPAAIPDLKKSAEDKAAAFAWSSAAPVARSAASASALAPRGRPPSAFERLNSTSGRLAVLALLMLIGGGALSVTAFRDTDSGGGGLAGIQSTIKVRAVRGQDSMGFSRSGFDTAKKGRMNFDLIKAGEKNPYHGEAGGGAGAPGAEGDAPMNYDDGPASRAGASGAAAGAAPGQGLDDGAPGGRAGGGSGFAAPRLSSQGKINFQGMRRVSGTAGFRGIQGRQGPPSRTIQNRGSAANSSGAAGGGDSRLSGSGFSSFGGSGSRAAGGASGRKEDSGSGGGGGTGGGKDVDVDGLDDAAKNNLPSIPDLMSQAKAKRDEAEKEDRRAKILAAGGHLPQAHYHYDKAEKAKKQAEGLEAQANQQLDALQEETGALTAPE